MSGPIRKRKHPHVQPEHAHKPVLPFKPETLKRLLIYGAVIVLAAIPFAMGKYIEFKSPDPFDSGCYVYSAEKVINGARIGIEEKPSAQIGTLLINIIGVSLSGFNETGSKLIQTLLQLAALVVMFITMRKLFGTLAAAVGVIVASTYLSSPLVAKFGNVKEQHMIAFMVLGMCSFVWYQLSGKWWYAVLAGASLVFAPLFKETGISAGTAVGLFVLLQPLLRHGTWKRTGTTIALLLAGAVVVVAPICLWLARSGSPIDYYPYRFVYKPIIAMFQNRQPSAEPAPVKPDAEAAKPQNAAVKQGLLMRLMPPYVRDSWRVMTPEQVRQAKLRVLRWYWVLILPISLAAGAIIVRLTNLVLARLRKSSNESKGSYDRFVLLFAVWWLLDMTFVWISPHSYEQYYLPLNASASVLGGYLVGVYYDKAKAAASRPKWVATGALGLLLMIAMVWPVFGGVAKSPHWGTTYVNYRTQLPERRNGYAQRLKEVRLGQNRGPWEDLSEYIRGNSTPNDLIYVWGWFPGIYVQAQRFSNAPQAFEGTMHTLVPAVLSQRIADLLSSFEKQPPKFFVDTYKRHFPWDRPVLELWPNIRNGLPLVANPPADRQQLWLAVLRTFDVQADDLTKEGFLRPDRPDAVRKYEAAYAKALRERITDADEATRFEAMKPLRDYVMNNYVVVRTFGEHVLFQRK